MGQLLKVCESATCKTKYLQVQLIEHTFIREGEDVDKVLWKKKKLLASPTLYFNTQIK